AVAEIHPSARGFDRAADGYDRARPDYPAEAIALVEGDTPRHRGTRSAGELARSSLFAEFEAHEFALRQELDEDGLVDRVLSVSFVAEAGRAVRARIEAQVRDLARGLPRPVVLPYTTQLFLARRLP